MNVPIGGGAPRSGDARVLVNLLWMVPGVVGGSEDSVTGLLRAIGDADPSGLEVHLAVLDSFAGAHPELAERFPTVVAPLDGSDKVRRVLAEQTWLARTTRGVAARVVHQAGGVAPLVSPAANVLTVHDLQPLDQPRNFSLQKRAYLRAMVGRSARAAAVVAVPSEFTRDRVVDLLGVDADRVAVVPWFVRPRPEFDGPEFDGPEFDGPDDTTGAVDGDRPFLLYPAITYPHKNHRLLIDAFALLAGRDPDVQLVLTGGEGSSEHDVRRRIAELRLEGRVVRPGRVERPLLERLYRDAAAVVVPSTYEGFGLPVLEAQVRGCPVLAASAGSLPEVAGPSDLVAPSDVTAWAAAMHSVLQLSTHERAARIESGYELAARFTSERTAAEQLSTYRRAATS